MPNRFLHTLWRFQYARTTHVPPFDFGWHRRAFAQAEMLVRAYYLFIGYYTTSLILFYWHEWRELTTIVPIWPTVWIPYVGIKLALDGLAAFAVLTQAIVLLFPERRVWRILAFVAYLEWYGFVNSFGKIGHDGHMVLITGFFFIFLPSATFPLSKRSTTYKQIYLTVFAGAQLLLATSYTMAGTWKVVVGLGQWMNGSVNTFHPDALAMLVAYRLQETNSPSLLGWLVVDYPLLGWPLHLAGVYLEFFAVIAALRPSLHRVWGLGLILLHIGAWFFLGILFRTNVFLLGILFVFSPFASDQLHWQAVCYELPIIGSLLRIIHRMIIVWSPCR